VCPGVRPWVVRELDLAYGASCSNKYLTGHRLCCPTTPEAHSNLNNNPTYNERTMPNSARTFTSVVIGSQPSTLSLEIFPALGSPTRQATSSRSLIASRTSSIFWSSRNGQQNAGTQSRIPRHPRANGTSGAKNPDSIFSPRFQPSIANESIPQISDTQVHESEEQASELGVPQPSTEAPILFNVFASVFVPSTNQTQTNMDSVRHAGVVMMPSGSSSHLLPGTQLPVSDEPIPQSSGTQVQQSIERTFELEITEPSTATPISTNVSTSQPTPRRNQTKNHAVKGNSICLRGVWYPFFRQGDIVQVTIHAVHTNPKSLDDDNSSHTQKFGSIYSQSRPAIVLRKFHKHMECLPIYTHNSKGMSDMSEQKKKEYLHVMRRPRGPQQLATIDDGESRLIAESRGWVIDPQSVVHVAGSVRVSFAENIRWTGVLEVSSFQLLHRMRAELNEKAEGGLLIE
jgi:hypothetical protein